MRVCVPNSDQFSKMGSTFCGDCPGRRELGSWSGRIVCHPLHNAGLIGFLPYLDLLPAHLLSLSAVFVPLWLRSLGWVTAIPGKCLSLAGGPDGSGVLHRE